MNREQKRRFIKNAAKNGMTKERAKAYAEISSGTGEHTEAQQFEEGDKLMLNVPVIKARKNYPIMNASYKEFVESSEGTIFTAHKENDNLISLVEEPKWLFWSGDLIKVHITEQSNDE